MPISSDPALRWSRVLLKVLIVFNICGCAILLACLAASFPFEGLARDVIAEHAPKVDANLLIPTLRVWVLLALPAFYAIHILLRRVLDILATVDLGSPFVPENAVRLRTIAWCLLVVQVTHLVHGVMANIATAAQADMDWDFSLVGWLAVLLLFVLARVFEQGSRMQGDLDSMI